MATKEPMFATAIVEALAKVVGDAGSGSDINRILKGRGIDDNSGESTKWKRLYWVFSHLQRRDGCANGILGFIAAILAPARFAGKSSEFEVHRTELNGVLVLAGFHYGADGTFHRVKQAATLDEAEARVRTIRAKFKGRMIHPEVLKYCRVELMHDNYFHAVFEAAKGLAQRIREVSRAPGDGAGLVDQVFSVDRPMLAFNSLQTETERSEHKGFAALLKGTFAAVRNPLAHEPKILWQGEEDAADWLSLISLLHRKLDGCVRVR
ncbi:MAG: TIGR02391 family protein [Gemmatimonadetes bacterium]|jgi:uncharacterized protein (TIGR02391 family)|nr:TIGR02391 family protein [Gemmatimonadota bacterium]MBL0178928.1 TIGR02391 family protein [Gemmatimonadota bacterium]